MDVTAKAPGKLFLVGEYAVVEPGHPAVVAAVDRFVTVRLQTADSGQLSSSLLPDESVAFSRVDGELVFPTAHPFALVAKALELAETYVREQGRNVLDLYRVEIVSDLDDPETGRKYGLGSSGAVTVAVIKAVLDYYQLPASPLLVYKLSVLTQLSLSMNGSFGDIAASSFGGIIAYTSCDRQWLWSVLSDYSLTEVIDMPWKDLSLESISLPEPLQLLVGWTGEVVRTDQMLAQSNQAQTEDTATSYQDFLKASRSCVSAFITACQQEDIPGVKDALRTNRQLLQELGRARGITIETPALENLCACAESQGAAAKTSGAGGGDCGICLVESSQQIETIYQAWRTAGIIPLSLQIASY